MFKSIDLANLTVHAFDANGFESNGATASTLGGQNPTVPISPRPDAPSLSVARSQQLLARQGHLAVLPDRTGGRTVLNTNDPEGRVPAVFRESESYYLLGFEPGVTDGRTHAISVRVNRSDVTVRSRRAHVADRRTGVAPASSAERAHRAITSPLPSRQGMTLTANALTSPLPITHNPTLVVALHARHEAIEEPLAPGPEPVTIVTAVLTLDGRLVGTFNQTLSVVARTGAPGAGVSYDVLQRFAAKPGRYELRIAVDNPRRRQSGSVFAFVDVPAFGTAPFAWGDVGMSSAAVTPATKDPLADVVPLLPTARRDFDRHERVTAFMGAYHNSGPLPSAVEIGTRITDERNRRRFERRSPMAAADFDASGRAVYTIDLPLASLDPGSYLLTMEATGARAKTTRHVRFSVR
jgi:hypothetical protein